MGKTFALVLLLTGCAATTPRVETVRVLVPTPVPCVAAADVPVRPDPLPKDRPANDRDAVRALLAALLAWAGPGGYGDRAAAVFTGCRS